MDLSTVYLVMSRIASFFLTLWLNFDIAYDEEYRQLRSRNASQLQSIGRKKSHLILTYEITQSQKLTPTWQSRVGCSNRFIANHWLRGVETNTLLWLQLGPGILGLELTGHFATFDVKFGVHLIICIPKHKCRSPVQAEKACLSRQKFFSSVIGLHELGKVHFCSRFVRWLLKHLEMCTYS